MNRCWSSIDWRCIRPLPSTLCQPEQSRQRERKRHMKRRTLLRLPAALHPELLRLWKQRQPQLNDSIIASNGSHSMSAIRMLFILVMFSGLLFQITHYFFRGEKKKVRNHKFENLPQKIKLLNFVNDSYTKFKQQSLLLNIQQNKMQRTLWIGFQHYMVF